MKKYIFYLTASILFLLTNCSSDKEDWKNAKAQNSVQAYEKFIEEHPQTVYKDSANLKLEEIFYKNAIKYKITYPDDGFGSFTKDIEIKMNKDFSYDLKAITDSSNIPMKISLSGGKPEYGLASLGSRNIKIGINKEVGYTNFAGLLFDKEVFLNINNDSTVEISEENLMLKGSLSLWISKKIKYSKNKQYLLIAANTVNIDSIINEIPLSESSEKEMPTVFPDELPVFPGCYKTFISNNLIYPKDAKDNGIEGKVLVRFVVSYRGEIRDISIVRGINDNLDMEALRVVKMFPKWMPGKQNGKTVNVELTIPIEFKL